MSSSSSSPSMAGSADAPDASSSHPTPDPSGNPQAPSINGSQNLANAAHQMPTIFYPLLLPGSVPMQNPEENGHGAGLYAVPFYPFMGPMSASSPCTLIPVKYKIPTRTNSAEVAGEAPGQEARRQHGPQRQVVVRRFQFAIQLDLALILKLAAAVFLFNQEGSRQRLIVLVFFATLVYLYQTGVLSPFSRWIRRGAAPPEPRPAIPPVNAPPIGHDDGNEPRPEGAHGVEDQNQNQNQNQNQAAGTEDAQALNENQPEPERGNGINWLGIAREIQMIVVGFVTSLLPGFHHHND